MFARLATRFAQPTVDEVLPWEESAPDGTRCATADADEDVEEDDDDDDDDDEEDDLADDIDDLDDDPDEERWIRIATARGRLLLVVYTVCGERIRIISRQEG